MKICLFLVLSTLSTVGLILGQEIPRIVSYDKSLYYADNPNWMVKMDDEGRMLFANSAGLLIHNGTSWSLNELPKNQVLRCVEQGPDGNIYTGAFNEFGFWVRSMTGAWEYTSLSDRLKEKARAFRGEIWNIISRDSSVIFQTFGTLYEYKGDSLFEVRPPYSISLLFPVKDRIYVQVNEHGLMELTDDNRFLPVDTNDLFKYETVRFIVSSNKGLLVGMDQSGIYELHNGTTEVWKPKWQPFFAENKLNKGINLSNGSFAFGTILDGLILLDPEGNLLHHFNKKNGLQNNTVLSILQDRDYNIWVGLNQGIDFIQLNSDLKYYHDINGILGSVFDALKTDDGDLLLATNQGLFRKHGDGFSLIKGSQGQVWQLFKYQEEIFVGHAQGTFILQGNSLVQISDITGGWYHIQVPWDTTRLLQSNYSGLAVLHQDSKGWIVEKQVSALKDVVRRLAFDENNVLWAVNPYQGLYKVEMNQDFSITQMHAIDDSMGLPQLHHLDLITVDNEVLSISDGKLWNYNQGRFNRYSDDAVQGNIHKSFQITKDKLIFWVDDRLEYWNAGIKTNNISIPNLVHIENARQIDDQTILLALDDGYALWDLENRVDSAIDRSEILLESVRFYAKDNRQKYWDIIPQDSVIEIPRSYSNVQFEYTHPQYTHNPMFQFRLNGFDVNWSNWTSDARKEYTNLPKGAYTFQIKSSIDNVESSMLSFVILPHWYETNLAIILYAMALVLLISILRKYHLNRLYRQRKRLEIEKERQLQRQRLQMKNEKLQFDIRNKSKDLAQSAMLLVRKNDALSKIQGQLNEVKGDLGNRLPTKHYNKLNQLIENELLGIPDRAIFESNFDDIYEDFYKRMKEEFPELTPSDLKLAAYLRMNLQTRDIAPLLNISIRGLENKRYRLRKKLRLETNINLVDFLIQY